jgi:hypothetical protein
MLDDANRPAETERPHRADRHEQHEQHEQDADQHEHRDTGTSRTRNIQCGPTDEERSERPTRSGRGRRERESEPSGRYRRRES